MSCRTVFGVGRGLRALPAAMLLMAAMCLGSPAVAEAQRCDGGEATIVGTPGDDQLEGTGNNDVIVGLGGNDVIRGRGGWDRICGGAGSDLVIGGQGNDFVHGGAGEDRIFGEYRSAERNQHVVGCAPGKTAAGYQPATSYVSCGDTLNGGGDADYISGGPQDDSILGRAGDDVLRGQEGGDSFLGGVGDDTIRGGAGRDSALFTRSSAGVTVDLAAGTAIGEGTDSLDSILAVSGSKVADRIYGDANANLLWGGQGGDAGRDLLVGRDGDDYLTGQGGNDDLRGGRARDFLSGGVGNDSLDGGRNRDTCISGEMLRRCEQTSLEG